MSDPKPALDDVDAELALAVARELADQLPVADGLTEIRRRTR